MHQTALLKVMIVVVTRATSHERFGVDHAIEGKFLPERLYTRYKSKLLRISALMWILISRASFYLCA